MVAYILRFGSLANIPLTPQTNGDQQEIMAGQCLLKILNKQVN
jgi:hypothetical protein